MASLRNSGNHFCGGIIFTPVWVLTSGTCASKISDPSNATVVVGSIHLNAGKLYKINHTIVHEEYSLSPVLNDIGLVKVTVPISFNIAVQPIPLYDTVIEHNTKAIISGWGQTSFPNGTTSPILQYLEVTVLENTLCGHIYDNITDRDICALHSNGYGLCIGDAGSPLVFQNKLIGIASYGKACAIGAPEVYARITRFFNWILINTSDY